MGKKHPDQFKNYIFPHQCLPPISILLIFSYEAALKKEELANRKGALPL